MKFWGVEVKPGEPLKVKLQPDKIIHVVQAALGEVENGKGPKNFPIHVKVDDKKHVIGNLSSEDRPQSVIDLVFEREFELSHDWKNGSVYFAGCITNDPCMDYKGNNVDEDEVVPTLQNGKLNLKMKTGKLKEVSDQHDDDSNDSEEDSSDFSAGTSSEGNLDDSDDSDADAYELKPKLDQPEKKRPFKSVAKTHVPAKKGKLATPERRGGKKDYLAAAAAATNTKSKKQKSK